MSEDPKSAEEQAHWTNRARAIFEREANATAFSYAFGPEDVSDPGLTKRELFAAMAMQGMLAAKSASPAIRLARESVDLADALIATLGPTSR